MTNRHQRRAIEKAKAARTRSLEAGKEARLQAAQYEVSRLSGMFQTAQNGLRLAAEIPVVPVEGEVAVEDDPNFFRTAAIEDFTERLTLVRVKLIAAQEELYLAMDGLDPADQGLVVTPPNGIVVAN